MWHLVLITAYFSTVAEAGKLSIMFSSKIEIELVLYLMINCKGGMQYSVGVLQAFVRVPQKHKGHGSMSMLLSSLLILLVWYMQSKTFLTG